MKEIRILVPDMLPPREMQADKNITRVTVVHLQSNDYFEDHGYNKAIFSQNDSQRKFANILRLLFVLTD